MAIWAAPRSACGDPCLAADAVGRVIVAAKGAPEAIAELCRLGPSNRAAMAGCVDAMAADGMRVLGVALGAFARATRWPQSPRELPLQFLRAGWPGGPAARRLSPAAVRECREAGIRVVMITGDYPRPPGPSRSRRFGGRRGCDRRGPRPHR